MASPTATVQHDIIDEISGCEARIKLDKSFQQGIVRFSPAIALNWTSSELANHDFGVPVNKATAERPTYVLDDIYSVEVGLGMFVEITRDWLFIINVAAESLSDDVTTSPIVSEDYVIKGFGAINYVF